LTDLGAGLRQRAHVVDVEVRQAVGDALGQRLAATDAVRQEVAEGLRGGGKTARHAYACLSQLTDHLAERGVLAADGFDIRHAQVFE
jgi:hypothetical protein